MSLYSDMSIVGDDRIWRALADPTRRRILESLDDSPSTTGGLVQRFERVLGRTGVMKHLDVLEGAQLIRVNRVGRTRHNHLKREPLKKVATWLNLRVNQHEANLLQLKALVEKKGK